MPQEVPVNNLISWSKRRGAPQWAVRTLLLGLAVYGVTALLVFLQGGAGETFLTPVWPACGVGLVGLLRWGRSVWPGIYLPALISSLLGGNPVWFSLIAPAGLVLALLLSAVLLTRLGFRSSLETSRDVTLLLLCAVTPMILAGLWTGGCLVAAGMTQAAALPQTAAIYWLANATGIVVVAPFLLLMIERGRSMAVDFRHTGNLALLVLLGSMATLAFSGVLPSGSAEIFGYLPFPFLVWLALRSGLPVTAAGILWTVGVLVFFSSQGRGPFAAGRPLENFAHTEVFLGVFISTGLLLAAGAEAARRERQLREELARKRAEMERIKAQVHPHFLFNCLAAIHSLAGTNTEAAQTGIVALSELLRDSLDATREAFVPLGREMRLVENYLHLQKMRFEDALVCELVVDDTVAGVPVPPVLIQPLVENAIKHGAGNEGPLAVAVAVRREGDLVRIAVRNSVAADCADPQHWQTGTGNEGVTERVAAAWSGRAKFLARRTAAGEVCVEIIFPYEEDQ